LEFNETDPDTLEERTKILQPHFGYIHPIKTPENQNARCLKLAPYEDSCICLIIDRMKFRKIIYSVRS